MSDYVLVETVGDFVQGVINTLKYWRNIHTEPNAWLNAWVPDMRSTVNLNEVGFSNSYFDYDTAQLIEDIAEIVAMENKLFYCCECGSEYEEDGECEDCGELLFQYDTEYFVEVMDITSIDTDIFTSVAINKVFPVYQEAIAPFICDVLENINYLINKIESAENNFDKLAAVIEALGIAHCNGEIFEDYIMYTMDMEFSDILNIRENGITSFFESDDVKAFMDS